MSALLGQVVAPAAGWSLGGIAIAIVIILALVGIVYVAAKAMGVPIPQWLVNIALIVVIAIVAIVAIKFLLSV